MDKIAVKNIAAGMLTFQPSISFTTNEDPGKTVRAAIDSNPKIVYYLQSCSISGRMNHYVAKPQYQNKETKLSDIYVVQSVEECLHHMCRSAGDYKKLLIVVAPKTVQMDRARTEFLEKHAVFYSNLVSLASTQYHVHGAYIVYEYEFEYRIGRVKLNMMEQEVDAEVERITKLLYLPGMPPEAKVYLVHNYLATSVLYRDKHRNSLDSSYTQSAYGALIKHECVCQGYAEAFKRIMDYSGIYCDVVSGQIVGSDEYHAWNIVSFGETSAYYHIDVTWDSSGEPPKYVYFCKQDSFFEGKRTWNRALNRVCTGKDSVLTMARIYLRRNKDRLLAKGVDKKILDC